MEDVEIFSLSRPRSYEEDTLSSGMQKAIHGWCRYNQMNKMIPDMVGVLDGYGCHDETIAFNIVGLNYARAIEEAFDRRVKLPKWELMDEVDQTTWMAFYDRIKHGRDRISPEAVSRRVDGETVWGTAFQVLPYRMRVMNTGPDGVGAPQFADQLSFVAYEYEEDENGEIVQRSMYKHEMVADVLVEGLSLPGQWLHPKAFFRFRPMYVEDTPPYWFIKRVHAWLSNHAMHSCKYIISYSTDLEGIHFSEMLKLKGNKRVMRAAEWIPLRYMQAHRITMQVPNYIPFEDDEETEEIEHMADVLGFDAEPEPIEAEIDSDATVDA